MKREPPERSAPHRSAGYAFRRPVKPATERAAERTAEPARQVVASAVDTAYRVYDDYLQCARKLAAQQPTTRDWRTPMGPKPLDPQAAASQWLEIWQEMMRMWVGALSPLMPAAQGMMPFVNQAAKSPWSPPAASGFPAPAQGVELEFELETTQRARVSLHFLRKPSSGLLRAQLHREEGEGRLTLELDPARIQIKVAAEQAPGTYSGVIRDGQGEQLGMLTVQLFGHARSSV